MPHQSSARNAYQTPTLSILGSLREVTKTADNSGMADGPSGGNMDKT